MLLLFSRQVPDTAAEKLRVAVRVYPGSQWYHTRVTMTNDTVATTLKIYDTSSKMLFFYSNV